MAVSRRKPLVENEKTPDYAAIGEMLRDTRDSYGLSVDEAAHALHVKAAVITALEKGRLEHIPGGLVYAKGHLRSYAHYLGVNLATMLSLLTIEAEVKPVASVSPSHSEPRRMRLAAWVSVGIILCVGLFLMAGNPGREHQASLVKAPPSESAGALKSSHAPGLASPCITVSEHPVWPPCFRSEEAALLLRLKNKPYSTVMQAGK